MAKVNHRNITNKKKFEIKTIYLEYFHYGEKKHTYYSLIWFSIGSIFTAVQVKHFHKNAIKYKRRPNRSPRRKRKKNSQFLMMACASFRAQKHFRRHHFHLRKGNGTTAPHSFHSQGMCLCGIVCMPMDKVCQQKAKMLLLIVKFTNDMHIIDMARPKKKT